MTVAIVICLEPVHIEQSESQGLTDACCTTPFTCQHFVEAATIGETGQGIGCAQGGQLVVGLFQFESTLGNLSFQHGIRFLQLFGHSIKAISQIFEFVTRANRNAVVENSAANQRCAILQGMDGFDHPAHQCHAGKHGQQHADEHQRSAANGLGIQRAVGFGQWFLDKNEPAKLWNRSKGSQDRLTVMIARLRRCLSTLRLALDRRLHLRQCSHTGVSQHQADIGMSNQAAFGVDCIGVAGVTDLDARDSVEQKFEVDFGDGDPGFPGADGHRYGHVQTSVAEVDRAAVGTA
ncbi:MAG: hypothetical protein AW09_004024 [Candidatus Accumulibacter phosphatis]|uniref:Uncharacterized protein n=1 Tax=Candidatus Accumulibacter phosphatis TaxID=327160 RepID=A0A080M0Y6_9PROT|nr:MAG: hypothetical protein AW09_004024 [Candidatus Accumulibacter phosphatis]